MTEGMIADLGGKAILLVVLISGPLLGLGLMAGLIIGVFQAVTSIHEMTLTFVPKILAVVLGIILFGPWMLRLMITFATFIFGNLHNYVR